MDEKGSAFTQALKAAELAVSLFEGGPDTTFPVQMDSVAGTLSFKNYTVHIRENGVHRVTCGSRLVHSSVDPLEAVIEGVAGAVAERTKHVLREFFERDL